MQFTTILLIAVAMIVAAFAAGLQNFRFLLYPLVPDLNPTLRKERLSLKGRTLFISDLHLEANKPFAHAEQLRAFIESRGVSNLIVNGDLFNSHEDASAILHDGGTNHLITKLGLNGLTVNLFWVVGSPAHDLEDPIAEIGVPLSIRVLGNCVSLDLDGAEILLYHGDDLSVKGAFGHGWDKFISSLSLERAWKRLAKVEVETWVFFGHTHIPGVDPVGRVANSGGWQKVPFVKPTRTGLLMSAGQSEPELVTIA